DLVFYRFLAIFSFFSPLFWRRYCLKVSAFEAEHVIHLLLKLRIMIADNVGKGDLCDRTILYIHSHGSQILPASRLQKRQEITRKPHTGFNGSCELRNKNAKPR
ncbi:hypothetical protein, partial [Bathymodiolus platifrons methanotrophic gill symbiont]|uniref:hypothetical protein n=1 Tax=Bathymodiolus platifrons methanotrophic gill symbiont TaxID=113268 RepID=UPI001B7D8159